MQMGGRPSTREQVQARAQTYLPHHLSFRRIDTTVTEDTLGATDLMFGVFASLRGSDCLETLWTPRWQELIRGQTV